MLDSVHESPLGDVPSKKTSCNKIVNCDRATACVVLDLGELRNTNDSELAPVTD